MSTSSDFTPSQNHWTMNGYRETVSEEEARHVLLNRPDPIVAGRLKKWQAEPVNERLGVWEIWIADE